MHDPLRDALRVEMRDFLAQMEIFQDRRPPVARFQRILIIIDQ
jgi:hypothetical protein